MKNYDIYNYSLTLNNDLKINIDDIIDIEK